MRAIIITALAALVLTSLGQDFRIETPAETRAMAAAEKDRQANMQASPVYLKLSADLPTSTANVDAARLLAKYVAQYKKIRCITIEYRREVVTDGNGFIEIVHLGYDRDLKGLLHQSHSKFVAAGTPSTTQWNAWTNIEPKDFLQAMQFDDSPSRTSYDRKPLPFQSPQEFLIGPSEPE